MNTPLIIAGLAIRQDADGRFCLNDFHAASGGEHRHRPSFWLTNQKTKEIVADRILNSGNPEIAPVMSQRGRYGGTYCIKQLVYSYAMWVSARFHNQVVDAYDAMARVAEPEHVIPRTLAEALRAHADLVEEHEELKRRSAEDAPKREFHDAVAADETTLTFREVAKVHGMSDRELIAFLINEGVLFRQGKSVLAKQAHLNSKLFKASTFLHPGGSKTSTRVTGKGQVFIQRRLAASAEAYRYTLAA